MQPVHRTSEQAKRLAHELVHLIPTSKPLLFNPYRERSVDDTKANTTAAKVERLAAHLDCDARFILCGEAPGYQGCRLSGVAFTSERQLLEGKVPRIAAPTERLSTRKLPFSEPSATTVWRVLYALGMAERTILWNALQMHPFQEKPEKGKPPHLSNRRPEPYEVPMGRPALMKLISAYPNARVVAVGQIADGQLKQAGITPAAAVRHPSMGGVTAFESGLRALLEAG